MGCILISLHLASDIIDGCSCTLCPLPCRSRAACSLDHFLKQRAPAQKVSQPPVHANMQRAQQAHRWLAELDDTHIKAYK